MLILLISKIPLVIVGEVMLHYGASRLLGRHGLGRVLDRLFARLLHRPRRARRAQRADQSSARY
jgi:hypothetical protein